MTKKKPAVTSEPKIESPADDDALQDELDSADETIDVTYSITSYGADYPVDALINRVGSGDIVVPRFSWEPDEKSSLIGFQREYVWPRPKADKFIDSLLLGLPVPGIFLVKEPSGRLLVLDGHQRLYSLSAFYKGIINGQEYRLGNVQPRFQNLRYKDLDTEDRRRLDDSIIHATVVRQDEPSEDQSSIYVIFERLNTGGVNLQPQEIRVALYHGEFVRVLRDLNEHDAWRELYGRKSKRLKDMEMILRFFAFLFYQEQYRSPMKDFLNRYMATNRGLAKQDESILTDVFTTTTSILAESVGSRAFRPVRAANAAVIDSVMTGLAKRVIKGGMPKDLSAIGAAIEKLFADKKYTSAIETGTSQEANVTARMSEAEKVFADLK